MSGKPGEREQCLVGLILNTLDGYERGVVGLARLVADVEAGIEALFDVADNEWVERLRSAWFGLEIVYAMALDEGRSTTLTDEEREDVATTVAELRALLALAPRPDLRSGAAPLNRRRWRGRGDGIQCRTQRSVKDLIADGYLERVP